MNKLISIGKHQARNFKPHQHKCWEIVYYTEGNGFNKIGNAKIDFSPGSIICQPPDIKHSEHSVKGYQNIFFTIDSFDLQQNNNYLIFSDDTNQSFLKTLNLIYQQFHIKKDNWSNIVNGLLHVLSQFLISWKMDNHISPIVERLKMILINHIGTCDLQIKNILHQLPYSNNYLRAIFKENTGQTPLEYLTELRIEHAKKLLSNKTKININQVSLLVGYSDPLYFSRVFKKSTGQCPTAWKNE